MKGALASVFVILSKIDDGLLLLYGDLLQVLMVHAKHNRAEMPNANTYSLQAVNVCIVREAPKPRGFDIEKRQAIFRQVRSKPA